MNQYAILAVLGAAATLLAVTARAPLAAQSEQQTGVLRDEPGSTGNRLGARVLDSYSLSDEDLRVILVQVPALEQEVDRVEVIGADGRRIEQARDAELTRDEKSRHLGIRLYLKRRPGVEFRIRLIDEE